MRNATLFLALLGSTPALADDPEFLLDAYGVRVDLPKGWSGTPGTWTNESFDASAAGDTMFFFSWGSDFQSPMTKDHLDAWGEVMVDKALKRRMTEAKVVSSELRTVGRRKVAFFELDVSAPAGKGVMYGSAEAVDGHVFHMMVMTGTRKKRQGAAALDAFVQQLDIQTPPAELGWGGEVAASGHSAKLPADWRPVLETEAEAFKPLVRDLGLADLTACWTAIRPHGPAKPDVMVACPAPIFLGVVDAHSAEGVEAELRPKLFGEAPIAPASARPVADRTGFVYGADLGGRKMAMGVVPYDQGVMRIWAMGAADDLATGLDSVLTTSSFSGPHPADLSAQASYYLSYRPFSPVVLGPVGLLVLVVAGGIAGAVAMGRKKPSLDDLDDDL